MSMETKETRGTELDRVPRRTAIKAVTRETEWAGKDHIAARSPPGVPTAVWGCMLSRLGKARQSDTWQRLRGRGGRQLVLKQSETNKTDACGWK